MNLSQRDQLSPQTKIKIIHPFPVLPCLTANAGTKRLPDIQVPPKPKVVVYQEEQKNKNGKKQTLQCVTMKYCAPKVTTIQIHRGLDGTNSDLEGAAWDFSQARVKIHNARLNSNKTTKLDRKRFQLESQSVRTLGIHFTNADDAIDR